MSKPWRALEQLVRDLERVFAGEEVTIKSPDWIPDRATGRPREVDVSIRRKVGSADILVILECRKRSDPEDVTWIEQLATKAGDIGASKMIAVSSKRFTSGAVDKAAAKNIELRTFKEITEGTALRWMGGVAYRYDLGAVAVTVKKSPEIGLVGGASVPFSASRVYEMAFVNLRDGAEVSLFQLLPLKEVFSTAADGLPFGERGSFDMRFAPNPGQVGVRTDAGVAEVAMIDISVHVERRLAAAHALSYQYVDQNAAIIANGTQLSLDHFGIPVVVNYAMHGPENAAGFVVRREDHNTDEILAYDFAFVGGDGTAVIASGMLQASAKPAPKRKPRSRTTKPTPSSGI